jgi:hypothetical protein
MTGSFSGKRNALVLPAVLLTISLLQEIVTFKVREHVHDVHVRIGILLVLNGAAFAIGADWISPSLTKLLTALRRTGGRVGGDAGLLLFYGAAYGLLYWAFFVLEKRGAGALLPGVFR